MGEEPPSLIFLNGNCLESVKEQEPEGGRRRLSHLGNMGWMRPSQEMTPPNRKSPFRIQAFLWRSWPRDRALLPPQNWNEELQAVRDLPTGTDLSSCCKEEPCSRGPKPLELPEGCSRATFSCTYRHSFCCLRQELVDAFVEHRSQRHSCLC
uniref:uncharacterized protein LOC108589499 isoform X2 n=1 Tax=Callithrix jacchus TaxID=9483 RepID=UPI0023DD48E7|nr:uncharacterized protein LOC108589499 isoform X2 [Callithrix jacchus]